MREERREGGEHNCGAREISKHYFEGPFLCSRKKWDGSGKVEPPCSCLAKISLHHSNMPTHREQATYYLEVAEEIPATADVVFGPAA